MRSDGLQLFTNDKRKLFMIIINLCKYFGRVF